MMLDIVVIVDQSPHIKATHVMYQSNTSWTVMKRLQRALIHAGCLEDNEQFITTQKGHELAESWRRTCVALGGSVDLYYSGLKSFDTP